MSRAKHWCFTLNNYTNEEVERLSTLPDSCTYLIYGKETSESGTPHLQGFISFKDRVRLPRVKSLLGDRAHVEVARKVRHAVEYCKKEGDFQEYGEFGTSSAGNRSDLDAFKEDVKGGNHDPRSLRELHSDVWAKYGRFCQAYLLDNIPERKVEDHVLKDWQTDLLNLLRTPPDDRKITFLVDFIGNSGKSWFCHWYLQNNEDSQLILPGKFIDMAYALRTDISVLFVDAPRSKQGEYLQYDFFEHVKNGYVFSSKYESRVKTLQKVHVVVMMNEIPDQTKLSTDRYNIILLGEEPAINFGRAHT